MIRIGNIAMSLGLILSSYALGTSWETMELHNQECGRQFQTSGKDELVRVQELSACIANARAVEAAADAAGGSPGAEGGAIVQGGEGGGIATFDPFACVNCPITRW